MNVNNNKSRKNSFLSHNLKNTSESNISNQNHQNNAATSNHNKNQVDDILSEKYNNKGKGKIIMNEILGPNFNNDPKISNKEVFSFDKDNRKFSNNPSSRQNSIFNKLSFDNAISKKAVSSLIPQQQDKQCVENTFKSSFNEKNSNFNFINNSNNVSNIYNINNKNSQNFNNGYNNSNTKNTHNERVNLASSKNEFLIINKSNNPNNRNIPGITSKSKDIIQSSGINNINNLNNLNANLNIGFHSGLTSNNISNNINLIPNHNFISPESLGSPIIPMPPPQQINVNINNYNINNYNIQSAIPLKSTKKFLKFENINSSNNKNLEYELSPKNFSNLNTNILSINNLNPLIPNGSNNNHLMNNQNLSGLINSENREYFSAGGKKGFINGNNLRYNINKFFDEQNTNFFPDGSNEDYNIEKNNLDLILNKDREKPQPYNNSKNLLKDKEGNINFSNNKHSLNHHNSKSSKTFKQDENEKNKNEKIVKNYNIKTNFDYASQKDNEGFSNDNGIKNIISKEIIFDPGNSAKNIESLVKPTEINNDSVINELADLFSATSNKDSYNFKKCLNNNHNSFFNSSGKDMKIDINLDCNLEEDLDINLNKYFFSDNRNSKNQNMNIENDNIKTNKFSKTREPSTSIIKRFNAINSDEENENNYNSNNRIIINKKVNPKFSNNEKKEKFKKNIKIKIEGTDNLNPKGNNPMKINCISNYNSNVNNNNSNNNVISKNNNFNNHNVNNFNTNNINRILSNRVSNSNRNINLIANNINTNINNIYSFKIHRGISENFKNEKNNKLNNLLNDENNQNYDSILKEKNFLDDNSLSLKNSTILEEFNHEIPDPRINFDQLKKVNSQRPQTSYGGLSERQKNLQLSLRQISSKLEYSKKREEETTN